MNQTFTRNLCGEFSRHNDNFFSGQYVPLLNPEAGFVIV